MRLEELSVDEWRSVLPDSGFGVFHTPEALSVLADHASGDLRLFGAYKGQRPVALLPLFVRERSVGTAVLSPPPGMAVPQLGPVVMPASPKSRKREQLNGKFVSAVLEAVGTDGSRTLFRQVCDIGYADPRPFAWADFELTPKFTYVLDLADTTPEERLRAASKSLRREVNEAREAPITVEVAPTATAARRVFEDTCERYREQGREFALEWPYVRDLTRALDERDRCRVYVARDDDGTYLGGVTVLYSNDRGYFWQGGTRSAATASVNSLLHWRIIEDIANDPPRESVTAYDLMGANTKRLCQYKAKFGADLRPYYVIESSGTGMSLAKKAYGLVRS